MLSQSKKRTVCQLGIFICSFVNFIIQLSVCLWPNWVEMVPKDQILFPNQAAMMGLWRQCIRYLPGKYECDDNQPGYELNENNSPQLLYSITTMRWLIIMSVSFSALSNLIGLIGYECITLAKDNYKFRRRCIRFSGFLIFLSGLCCVVALSYFAAGVFDELMELLKDQLQGHYTSLKNQEYVYKLHPIIFVAWFSSGLGLLCGISLCCLAGSMYDNENSSKQMKQRQYTVDLDLNSKLENIKTYQNYTGSHRYINQKDDKELKNNADEKLNQIETLDHHGKNYRKRHSQGRQKIPQNGTIPGSKIINLTESVNNDEVIIMKIESPADSIDRIDSAKDDFSFTLPKPQNLMPKAESLTDCDIETSLAVGPRSVQSKHDKNQVQAKLIQDSLEFTEAVSNNEFYAMEGYV